MGLFHRSSRDDLTAHYEERQDVVQRLQRSLGRHDKREESQRIVARVLAALCEEPATYAHLAKDHLPDAIGGVLDEERERWSQIFERLSTANEWDENDLRWMRVHDLLGSIHEMLALQIEAIPPLSSPEIRERLGRINARLDDAPPGRPRQLPIVTLGGRQYYVDERLREYRAVDNPHDRRPFA